MIFYHITLGTKVEANCISLAGGPQGFVQNWINLHKGTKRDMWFWRVKKIGVGFVERPLQGRQSQLHQQTGKIMFGV